MTDAGTAKRQDDAGFCSTPHPLEIIKEEHALQLELCELLEGIADGLPGMFEPALAVIAAVVVGIFAWGARDDMGVFDPDAALRAVLIVAVVYAIPWAIGHAASELRDPKAAA